MKDVDAKEATGNGVQLNIEAGTKVKHDKFENGQVLQVEGQGNNQIATILFENYGQKKIILKFAKLQVIT
jgi:DNA helicase-2/ATP-dependent DNA helicase PcrA